MATEVKLPRLGQGMESGTIVKWLKGEGEPVKKREPLYELDTDKVTQEVEAEADGVLLKIVVDSGEVEVGATIAFIGDEGEDVPSGNGARRPRPSRERPSRTRPTGQAESDDAVESRTSNAEGSSGRAMDDQRERGRRPPQRRPAETAAVSEGPRGRRPRQGVAARAPARAREGHRHRDAAGHRARGPHRRRGRRARRRSRRRRLRRAAAAAGEVEEIELTSTRKTIARRLTEAWQAPVFQLTVSVDMTRALELRERLVARLQEGETKPTVSDLLTKVCAAALVRHPRRERALRRRRRSSASRTRTSASPSRRRTASSCR